LSAYHIPSCLPNELITVLVDVSSVPVLLPEPSVAFQTEVSYASEPCRTCRRATVCREAQERKVEGATSILDSPRFWFSPHHPTRALVVRRITICSVCHCCGPPFLNRWGAFQMRIHLPPGNAERRAVRAR
jgi:hypothetical protein